MNAAGRNRCRHWGVVDPDGVDADELLEPGDIVDPLDDPLDEPRCERRERDIVLLVPLLPGVELIVLPDDPIVEPGLIVEPALPVPVELPFVIEPLDPVEPGDAPPPLGAICAPAAVDRATAAVSAIIVFMVVTPDKPRLSAAGGWWWGWSATRRSSATCPVGP